MAIGDVLQARFESVQGNQAAENIRQFRVSAEVAPVPTYGDVASGLGGIIGPELRALMSSSATYRGCAVRRISPLPLTLEQMSTNQAGVGAIAGDPLPPQVSGIVTLRTAMAGRRFRGRFYVPFPAESDNTSGHIPSSGYLSALINLQNSLALATVITVGLGSITVIPVIWSRRFRTTTDITLGVARAIWATQRRRGDYGRPNPPTI